MNKTIGLAIAGAFPVSMAAQSSPLSENPYALAMASVLGSLAAVAIVLRNAKASGKQELAGYDVAVAMTAGLGTGFYLGPPAERMIDLAVDVPMTAGCFIMAASGGPVVRWLVKGGVVDWVKKWLDRRGD